MFFSLGMSSFLDSKKNYSRLSKNRALEEHKLLKHEILELDKIRASIKNGTEIEFYYGDEYFCMIPNSLTDRLDHYSLSAYNIDSDGKKKWRRFQTNLMKKV